MDGCNCRGSIMKSEGLLMLLYDKKTSRPHHLLSCSVIVQSSFMLSALRAIRGVPFYISHHGDQCRYLPRGTKQ